MAKRQPFDTHLNFPPAPTRALISTPLDGIIGGPGQRTEPAPTPQAPVAAQPIHEPGTVYSSSPAPAVAPYETPAPRSTAGSDTLARTVPEAPEPAAPADDGKVTVKLPPDLKNRLYNAIYHERATVGDYLTRAVFDLMDQLERERGTPYPQRPVTDVKFRAGRRPN